MELDGQYHILCHCLCKVIIFTKFAVPPLNVLCFKFVLIVCSEPPTLLSEPPKQSVEEEGESCQFECQFRGEPVPIIMWLLNGESVTNDSLIKSNGKSCVQSSYILFPSQSYSIILKLCVKLPSTSTYILTIYFSFCVYFILIAFCQICIFHL